MVFLTGGSFVPVSGFNQENDVEGGKLDTVNNENNGWKEMCHTRRKRRYEGGSIVTERRKEVTQEEGREGEGKEDGRKERKEEGRKEGRKERRKRHLPVVSYE